MIVSSWNPTKVKDLEIGEKPIIIKNGDIEATFIDNSAYGQLHRSGYNGISELRHTLQDSSIFVPNYAGFNLEHVFAGDSLSPLFEPRVNAMELRKISEYEVELHQKELPLSHVESWTNFKVTEPNYLDISFRYVIHSDVFFKHNYAGLFWASYIHAPSDKSINFIGKSKADNEFNWVKTFSPQHGVLSTHLHENDKYSMYASDNFNVRLASHYSAYKYKDPFYYGLFHNMVLAYMFKPQDDQIIRFAQSPTGGGPDNPAWDFHIINPDFEVGKTYTFSARMVYKPFKNAEDIHKEYDKWNAMNK